jgi:hypothetical protein
MHINVCSNVCFCEFQSLTKKKVRSKKKAQQKATETILISEDAEDCNKASSSNIPKFNLLIPEELKDYYDLDLTYSLKYRVKY